jgi:hypothetical protein
MENSIEMNNKSEVKFERLASQHDIESKININKLPGGQSPKVIEKNNIRVDVTVVGK